MAGAAQSYRMSGAHRSRTDGVVQIGSKLLFYAYSLLIIFNVAFPKGGIKFDDFPVNWGYLLVGLLAPLGLYLMLGRRNLSTWPFIHLVLLFLPVAIMVVLKWSMYDLPARNWVPIFITMFVLPTIVLGAFSHLLEDLPAEVLGTPLRWAVRITVVWGLMNFVLFMVSRDFIEIPYLTVNADDVGAIFGKNNWRGDLMKLVSTYNNGNIYGVCMVMLMPLYFLFDKSRAWRIAFLIALVCTLSRTAWFGMIVVAMLMVISGQIRLVSTQLWLALGAAAMLVVLLLPLMGWNFDTIIPSDFAGRNKTLHELEITVFGSQKISTPEAIYLGFLDTFGVFGAVFPIAALWFSPIFGFLNWSQLSALRKAAVVGAMAYCLAAFLDAALVFPPVMLLYLFLTSLIYRRGLRHGSSSRGPRRRDPPVVSDSTVTR